MVIWCWGDLVLGVFGVEKHSFGVVLRNTGVGRRL
jgi:hypothetical protein